MTAEPETGQTRSLATDGSDDRTVAARRTDGETGRWDGVRAIGDQLAGLAHREFRLAVRSRWVVGLAVLYAVFTAGVVRFGAGAVGPARLGAVQASLAELGAIVIPLGGLAAGYDALTDDDGGDAMGLLRALPLPRIVLVAGVTLGRAAALAGATVAGFGAGAIALWLRNGASAIPPYGVLTLAAVLGGVAALAIGVLVSALAGDRVRALGGVLVVWLWLVLLHDLVGLAAIAAWDLPGRAVATVVLTNPVDCFRILAITPVDVVAGETGAILSAAGLGVGSLVAGLLVWIVGPVVLAARVDRRRH